MTRPNNISLLYRSNAHYFCSHESESLTHVFYCFTSSSRPLDFRLVGTLIQQVTFNSKCPFYEEKSYPFAKTNQVGRRYSTDYDSSFKSRTTVHTLSKKRHFYCDQNKNASRKLAKTGSSHAYPLPIGLQRNRKPQKYSYTTLFQINT